jgi:hypothetical protein
MSLAVPLSDYVEAARTQDPYIRRMKFAAIDRKVAQARAHVQERKARLERIKTEQKLAEANARIARMKAEQQQSHTEALQAQARENGSLRGYRDRQTP